MFPTFSNFQKLLDKATNQYLLEPDWHVTMQICDLIRQSDIQPKAALSAIKKKLTHQNPHVAFHALLVLESCVKNCGSLIHNEIGTRQYMEELKELIKTSPHENVKNKTLELIQVWAYAFRNNPKYRAVQDTVNIMKTEGYKFPKLKESDAMFKADIAPEWAKGEVCHRCRIAFGLVQRKHHCRACGQVFCAKCSSKTTTLPKYGIEKEVRVCESCYAQWTKPAATTTNETDLPAEYLNSSLAQQQQVPARKTNEELQEEEELQLAIALSQSEAEQKEREKKRATSSVLKSTTTPATRTTYSPPPSPGPSPSKIQEEEDMDPNLAKYLNRKYWEQRQSAIEEQSSRVDVTSPSAPNISSPMPQKIMIAKQQNGEIDNQMEEFVGALRSQVEIFVNRMKSNSSRGRSIANDSSVQTLFFNITAMHSRLLRYIQEQDDGRVYYEGLQDKLTQIKDARAALDALREEHREKVRRLAEEAERQRQLQMAQKLAIMRKQKQEYLQYQRQLALQKMQEQDRELQMRQEQQKQQYIMGGYQPVSNYMGPSQNSPVRHVQYHAPGTNYNPMSPTNPGVYLYGQQPPMNQYPMPGYNMQQTNSLPPHHTIINSMPSQEQQPADPTAQMRDTMGRISISGPGMMPQLGGSIPPQQMPQTGGHPIGALPGQQGHQIHVPPPNQGLPPPNHMAPSSGPPPAQMPQPGGPMGPMALTQQVMGIPPTAQIPQGPSHPQHVTTTTIPPPQGTTFIQVSGGSGPPGGVIPPATQPPMQYQPPPPAPQPKEQQPPAVPPTKEDPKPETAELISFD